MILTWGGGRGKSCQFLSFNDRRQRRELSSPIHNPLQMLPESTSSRFMIINDVGETHRSWNSCVMCPHAYLTFTSQFLGRRTSVVLVASILLLCPDGLHVSRSTLRFISIKQIQKRIKIFLLLSFRGCQGRWQVLVTKDNCRWRIGLWRNRIICSAILVRTLWMGIWAVLPPLATPRFFVDKIWFASFQVSCLQVQRRICAAKFFCF